MAFLNNVGTIKIDAILTDIGRKRMVQGRFKVTRFCLGDDEIDYKMFSVENNDGSKLKLAPTLEALNGENASLTYGLEDHNSDDILYIPQIKLNSVIDNAVKTKGSVPNPEFIYLSVNDETSTQLKGVMSKRQYLENNSYERTKLIFESGIEDSKLPRLSVS